jgi:hypothetical protein
MLNRSFYSGGTDHSSGGWLQRGIPEDQQYFLAHATGDAYPTAFAINGAGLVRVDGADARLIAHLYSFYPTYDWMPFPNLGQSGHVLIWGGWSSYSDAKVWVPYPPPDDEYGYWRGTDNAGRRDLFMAILPRVA